MCFAICLAVCLAVCFAVCFSVYFSVYLAVYFAVYFLLCILFVFSSGGVAGSPGFLPRPSAAPDQKKLSGKGFGRAPGYFQHSFQEAVLSP